MIGHSRICFYVGTFHRWIGQHFLSNEEYFLDEHLHLCKATNNEMMQRKESAISKGINVLPRRDEMYKYIKSTMKKEKNDRNLLTITGDVNEQSQFQKADQKILIGQFYEVKRTKFPRAKFLEEIMHMCICACIRRVVHIALKIVTIHRCIGCTIF